MMDYTTTSNFTSTDAGILGAFAAFTGVFLLVALVAYVLTSLGLMQFFKKADKPAWAAWVPIYNYYVMTEVASVPMYWFWILVASILLAALPVLGPFLSLAVVAYITHMFLQKFGKDVGHTILAVLFPYVYFPVVGYSKDLTYSTGAKPAPRV